MNSAELVAEHDRLCKELVNVVDRLNAVKMEMRKQMEPRYDPPQ